MRRRWRASAMWHNPRQLNLLAAALTAGATLALCAALGHWLMRQPMFALRVIRIDGDLAHLNLPSVRAAVSQLRNRRLYTHFFNLDLEETRAIFEAMRRVWPDQLALTLTEYQALGIWRADWLVSRDGERFAANLAEAGDGLPSLSGPEGSEKEVVARYRDFARWFAPLGLAPVSVSLSERRAWTVELSNGTRVELGRDKEREGGSNAGALAARGDGLEQRCRRLAAAWKAVTAQWGEEIQRVDLRYPNGFAILSTGSRA